MKTMTCEELGGACSKTFSADTFEEIAEMSKNHGMEMYKKGDQDHLQAMGEMQELMKSPQDMADWFQEKKDTFDALPED